MMTVSMKEFRAAEQMTPDLTVCSPAILPGLARSLDLLCILAVGAGSLSIGESDPEAASRAMFTVIFIALGYLALANYAKLYTVNAIMRPVSRADDVMVAILTAVFLFFGMALSLDAADDYAREEVALFAIGSFVALVAMRVAAHRVLARLARRGVISRSMVVLGTGEQAQRLLIRLRRLNPYFVNVIGAFRLTPADAETAAPEMPMLGDAQDLIAYARARKVDDIVIAMPWSGGADLTTIIEKLKELPVNVHLSTDLVGYELALRPVMGAVEELSVFEVLRRPISGWSSAFKAIEDYVIASLVLLIVAPLMALIAVAIRLDSPGPVFFMQKRLGFNNKVFLIYKFRSMRHGPINDADVKQVSRRDPRVTRVGRIIRATSLDELPQLLNVLNGTMSLVGPRPHALYHNEEFGRAIRGYFARHKVKPGITGWAQVNGLRGETETVEKMEARIRHDIYYADNWSLFFDLKILVMTAFVFLFQRSAY